jgi:hypothetical protein
MPYIVTHRPQPKCIRDEMFPGIISRRTVATLDEARKAAYALAESAFPYKLTRAHGAMHEQVVALPDRGGTIGPLPDGTVIEVKRVTNHRSHRRLQHTRQER